MNANEPAMTIISPINAGILVVIGSKYLYLFLSVLCLLYQPVFGFNFLGGGAPPPGPPSYGMKIYVRAYGTEGLRGGAAPHKKVLVS
jgi:hypothetical protein